MDAIKFIEENGGSAAFARMLKLPKKSGTQTVNNWKVRGFPSLVVLDNPKIFNRYLKALKKQGQVA